MARFWHALVTFGCGLTIPEKESDICRELMIPTWVAASLTNDLFSFQKEYDDAKKIGQPYVVNAVWVLMQERQIPEEEAKLECRKRIKEEIKKAIKNAELAKEMNVSEDLKRYLHLLLYSLSGNVVWSLQCPRYHKNIPYNGLQLQRAKYGIAKFPARWPLQDHNGLPAEEGANEPFLNGVNHSIGASSPLDHQKKRKLNGLAIDGSQTNGAQISLIANHVNGSLDKDQSGRDNAVTCADDSIFSVKLPELSDQVSIPNPGHLHAWIVLLIDAALLRSWRSPSNTLARCRPKECENASSMRSTCG